MTNLGQNQQFFVPRDLEIRQMTLKNNRAPLLGHFKLCESFHCHLCIKAGVMVRKPPNWDKICFDVCDLHLWPETLTFCMDITSVNSDNSWKFHYDIMMGNIVKKVWQTDGRTDWQMDWTVHRAPWSQLKVILVNFWRLGKLNIMHWWRHNVTPCTGEDIMWHHALVKT